MSHKVTKAMQNLKCEDLPEDAPMMAAVAAADSEAGEAVKAARAAGMSWPSIIGLMIEFGPKFAALIQALLAALETTPPPPVQAEGDLPPSYVDEHRSKKEIKADEAAEKKAHSHGK